MRTGRTVVRRPGLVLTYLLLAGIFAALPSPVSGSPPSPATAQAVSRVPVEAKVVFLTFDAGSDAGHTQAILDILAAEDIEATFFLTADWLEDNPDLAKAIVTGGHEVGNHTKNHPHLTQLTDEEIRGQLGAVEELAQNTLGRSVKPFFRAPFGEYDQRVAGVVGAAGYSYVIMWTVDSLDWKMIPAEEVTKRLVDGAEPGAIFLMHVGSQTNEPTALPETIRELRARGYGFARLSDFLVGAQPSTSYTVVDGDTVSSIARRFGVTVADILEVNHLVSGDAIGVGQVLLIPASGDGSGGQPDGDSAQDPGADQGGYGDSRPDGNQDQPSPGPAGLLGRLLRLLAIAWQHLAALVADVFA